MAEPFLIGFFILIISYLIGSVSFSWISMRLLSRGEKVEQMRIKEMGLGGKEMNLPMSANAVSMKHGSAVGGVVSLLDMLKGAAPTLAARLLFPDQPFYLIAALGVVAGHIWPVYFRFIGGAGIATMIGAILIIDWLTIPVVVLISLVVGLLILRNMGFVFLVLLLSITPWMWFRFGDVYHTAFAVSLLVFFLLSMIPTIRVALERLKAGTGFGDTNLIMESMPMGRGMNRILEFMHRKPRTPK